MNGESTVGGEMATSGCEHLDAGAGALRPSGASHSDLWMNLLCAATSSTRHVQLSHIHPQLV